MYWPILRTLGKSNELSKDLRTSVDLHKLGKSLRAISKELQVPGSSVQTIVGSLKMYNHILWGKKQLKQMTKGSHRVCLSHNPAFFLSGELVSALACHPEYKLLSLCTIPQMASSSIAYSTFSWPGLLKHLRQMLISNTKMEEGKCTLT